MDTNHRSGQMVSCPACEGEGVIEIGHSTGPSAREERCEICRGQGECSEMDALTWEVNDLRAQKLVLTAEATRLRAESALYRPVARAAANWRHAAPQAKEECAAALVRAIDRGTAEAEKLRAWIGASPEVA